MFEHPEQHLLLLVSIAGDRMHCIFRTLNLSANSLVSEVEPRNDLSETNPSCGKGGSFEQHIVGFHTAA